MERRAREAFDQLRKAPPPDPGICSRCGTEEPGSGHRWCRSCKARYMREWRPLHPLTKEQRRKDNARSYAGVYLRRGKIQRLPCDECGTKEAQMHHEDYDKPLEVTWLCRACHLDLHAGRLPKKTKRSIAA